MLESRLDEVEFVDDVPDRISEKAAGGVGNCVTESVDGGLLVDFWEFEFPVASVLATDDLR